MKTASFTKALTVALPEEIYLKIREITDEKNISMGAWVRVAVERELDNNEYDKRVDGGKSNE